MVPGLADSDEMRRYFCAMACVASLIHCHLLYAMMILNC